MKQFALVFCLFLTGCGWVSDVTDKVVDTVNPPSAEELEERKKREEELRLQRIEMIKTADQMVEGWAEDLHSNVHDSGGYVYHEGVTEADPWGTFLKVDYHQDVFDEVLVVTSAGPDSRFGTSDDLSRERRTSNPINFWNGISTESKIGIIWSSLAVVSFFLFLMIESKRRKRHKSNKNRSIAAAVAASIFLAPVVFLWNCFMFFGITVVDGFDLDTDFFDSGFDLDIDLDLDVFD